MRLNRRRIPGQFLRSQRSRRCTSALPTTAKYKIRVTREEYQQELRTRVETEESDDRSDDIQNEPGFLEIMKGEEGAEVRRHWEPSFHRLIYPKVNEWLQVH